MFAYSSQQQARQSWPNPVYSSQQQQPPTKGKVTCFLICGMYREWLDLAQESTALSKVREQLQAAAAEVDNVIFHQPRLSQEEQLEVRPQMPHA
jgi:hypothetical protein